MQALWNLECLDFASENGRHLIDGISDWPNLHGFTKGVHFVCLNRYVEVDQKPFSQSEIRSIWVLRGKWASSSSPLIMNCYSWIAITSKIAIFNTTPESKFTIVDHIEIDQRWIFQRIVTYLVMRSMEVQYSCWSQVWLVWIWPNKKLCWYL